MTSKLNNLGFDIGYESNNGSEISSSANSQTGSIEREKEYRRVSETQFSTPPRHTALIVPVPNGAAVSEPAAGSHAFVVEREDRDENFGKYNRKKTYFLSAVKCLLSILMSLLLFVCCVASKLSLVYIGQRLKYGQVAASNATNSSSGTCSSSSGSNIKHLCETTLGMLMLILICPSIYSLIKALCVSGMRKSHPWPTDRAIVWVSFEA